MKQEDLKIKGHAMVRVYAEDSMNDFYVGHLDVSIACGRWNSCR
jgi:acetyl/propionyl-CoA carboxylase alpha subunit